MALMTGQKHVRTEQCDGDGQSTPHAAGVAACPDAGSGRELHLREEDVALMLHVSPRDALQDSTSHGDSRACQCIRLALQHVA